MLLFLLTIPLFAQNTPSKKNSSSTLLDSAGVFTGTVELVSIYNTVMVTVLSSEAGQVQIQFGDKASTTTYVWIKTYTFTYAGGEGGTATYSVPVHAPYMRVIYTNGVVDQTSFNLITMLHAQPNAPTNDLGELKTNISSFPNDLAYANVRNSWDWARSLTVYSDTVKTDSVLVVRSRDTISIGGSEWSKVTIKPLASTDSIYFAIGTTAPSVWGLLKGTETFVSEKLSKTYFTKVFLKGAGLPDHIESYQVIIEAF